MPPIIVATWWPTGNSPPGHWATTPVASMPRTRGNVTPDARPWRVCNSDRFSPNALTSISTQPTTGVGTGSWRIVSASGGPGASRTIARMVSVIQSSWALTLGSGREALRPGLSRQEVSTDLVDAGLELAEIAHLEGGV